MRRRRHIVIGLAVFGMGYLLGSGGFSVESPAQAQPAEPVAPQAGPPVSEDTAAKIQEARYALQEAMDALRAEGRYESITADMNAFLILAGGGNAREDLESGRGVDPETFAALHAGLARPEIGDHLGYNENRRLTYQNRVVRMYSVSRLQEMYDRRFRFAEAGL